jgi:hypothetical protein
LREYNRWVAILALSFIFEVLLVIFLLCLEDAFLITIGALINGAAGCFYWSTQRILFQRVTQKNNTGNTFGNFQILVVISLKLGILLGSILLASEHLNSLFLISLSLSLLGYWLLMQSLLKAPEFLTEVQPKAFQLRNVLHFKDAYASRLIFVVDGLFLFLESYFWVLSLYLLTQQNLLKLGALIVVLSLLLALIFFIIKKRIDHINVQRIYVIAVLGYVLSWLLRGQLTLQEEPLILYAAMLLIAFLSSFFRLSFNKRFYDLARLNKPTQYIVYKSYYSQFALIVFFSLTGLVISDDLAAFDQLQYLYIFIAPLVLVYLCYGNKGYGNKGI